MKWEDLLAFGFIAVVLIFVFASIARPVYCIVKYGSTPIIEAPLICK